MNVVLEDTGHVLGDVYGRTAEVTSVQGHGALPSPLSLRCGTFGPLALDTAQCAIEGTDNALDHLVGTIILQGKARLSQEPNGGGGGARVDNEAV